ncbi:MAG: dethiobiotin synthase [Gemmatimonadales bacterium]
MPHFVVITGTDTGVGKTVVTAALGRSLSAAGRRTVAIKPIESGCPSNLPAAAEDGVRIARATGQLQPTSALRRYRTPVTPAVAADLEGYPARLPALVEEIRGLSQTADVVLLEGAGGLLSPPAWEWSYVDLARQFEASALIVAANRLGCLSHTLLTASALTAAGIPILGVVMSDVNATDESTGSNRSALERLLPGCPVASLRHLAPGEVDTITLDSLIPWFVR